MQHQLAAAIRERAGDDTEGDDAKSVDVKDFTHGGVKGATWVLSRTTPAAVLVATIDGMLDYAVVEALACSPLVPNLDVAGRIASFLRGADRDDASRARDWGDYARLCLVCATARWWRTRFFNGIVVDEGHLVCGSERRLHVAGQHRVPAAAVATVLDWWAADRASDGRRGRLVVLSDENQLNRECASVEEPVYPRGCGDADSAEVAVAAKQLLKTNLRNPASVRDSALLLYNCFGRDGTIQELHSESGDGRPLQVIDVPLREAHWGGNYEYDTMRSYGSRKKVLHAVVEDYAISIAAALKTVCEELSVQGEVLDARSAQDPPAVAVLTPHDKEGWGGPIPELDRGTKMQGVHQPEDEESFTALCATCVHYSPSAFALRRYRNSSAAQRRESAARSAPQPRCAPFSPRSANRG
jgi:hypothetical protein